MDETDEMTRVAQWLDQLRAKIDLAGLEAVDAQDLLDTVRLVAHGVLHAAGPVSAFAAGYAVAKAGGSSAAIAQTLADIREVVKDAVDA